MDHEFQEVSGESGTRWICANCGIGDDFLLAQKPEGNLLKKLQQHSPCGSVAARRVMEE